MSMAQLRNVGIAYSMYAVDNGDAIPDDVDELIDAYLGDDAVLESPYGPAFDGGPDYWLDASGGTMSHIRFPDERICAYDRAMYQSHGRTVVLFFDGHVELMEMSAFVEALEHAANAGVERPE